MLKAANLVFWFWVILQCQAAIAATTITGADSGVWGVQNQNLIVSRMQDHMVVTPNGHYHMLVNLGTNGGLTMFTSPDGGVTWNRRFSFPDSNSGSTSDIQLMADGKTLLVAYLNSFGQVAYAEYSFNPPDDTWTKTIGVLVDTRDLSAAYVNPTVTRFAGGVTGIAYTETTPAGLVGSVQLNAGNQWRKLDDHIPPATKGSSRIIAAPKTNGVINTTDDAMYWYTVDRTLTWSNTQILSIGTPDRYASHFSTTIVGTRTYIASADLSGRLVLLTNDGHGWQPPVTLIASNVFSAQISASADGILYIVADDQSNPNTLLVLESRDLGASWTHKWTLVSQAPMLDPPMKFETPDYFIGNLVVMQQVRNPSNQFMHGLYRFVVPVNDP